MKKVTRFLPSVPILRLLLPCHYPFESLISWEHGKQECENSRNVSRVSVLITRKLRLARIPFIWTDRKVFEPMAEEKKRPSVAEILAAARAKKADAESMQGQGDQARPEQPSPQKSPEQTAAAEQALIRSQLHLSRLAEPS